jgi:hypothetical protein
MSRVNNQFSASIFCKPTATDMLIHDYSCHPYEHKLAGINYLEHQIITYPMSETNQKKEVNICQYILNSNGFNHIDLINRIKKKTVHRSSNVGNMDDDNENMISKKMGFFHIPWN